MSLMGKCLRRHLFTTFPTTTDNRIIPNAKPAATRNRINTGIYCESWSDCMRGESRNALWLWQGTFYRAWPIRGRILTADRHATLFDQKTVSVPTLLSTEPPAVVTMQ